MAGVAFASLADLLAEGWPGFAMRGRVGLSAWNWGLKCVKTGIIAS